MSVAALAIRSSAPSPRPVALWLLAVAVLVFAMVVVGGVTRLTRSGLSIVEWNPIMGAIPPLTEQHWAAEFDKYRRTPEYQQVNKGMSLEGFKRIYYVEWAHRLLGRLIALVFFVPLLYFAARRQLSRSLLVKLLGLFVLGGLQGALGWFMVQSGLVDIPRVSPYRLTAHLGVAVVIYGYLLWIVFSLLDAPRAAQASAGLRRMSWLVTATVFLMILAGGFVAGTKAGFIFNTFPLMHGQFVPDGLGAMQPWWVNPFENVIAVQFNHRMLAYLLLALTLGFWWMVHRRRIGAPVRVALHVLVGALLAQVALGVATLLLVVPVWLGALHQAGALVVFTAALYVSYSLSAYSRLPSCE